MSTQNLLKVSPKNNLEEITKIAHEHGMKVLADEAHGTHLYFGNDLPQNAMSVGADMSAVSMHKAGGSLTQSSLLLLGEKVNARHVAQIINLTQTTSASYLLISSLDISRRNLALRGQTSFDKVIKMAEYARQEINCIGGYYAYGRELCNGGSIFDFDVTNSIKGELGKYAIDEYDLMPNENPHNIVTNFPVAEGNIFEAEENEVVKYVTCVSTEHNEDMIFNLYKFNGDKIDKYHPVLEFTKKFDNKGIHVVRLPENISLNQGEKLAVAVTQKSGDKYFLSVGSEYNEKGYLSKLCDDEYFAKGVVNKNESFVILENQVFDFADLKQKMEGMDGPTSFLSYDNFPIKLYASIVE